MTTMNDTLEDLQRQLTDEEKARLKAAYKGSDSASTPHVYDDTFEADTDIESVDLSVDELDVKLKKLAKRIPRDMVEELKNMSTDDLRRRIVRSQVNLAEVKAAMERDEGLADAKEALRNIRGPYADATKLQKAIGEYATLLLNS